MLNSYNDYKIGIEKTVSQKGENTWPKQASRRDETLTQIGQTEEIPLIISL